MKNPVRAEWVGECVVWSVALCVNVCGSGSAVDLSACGRRVFL